MTRWQPTHCPVCRRLLLHRAGAAILLCPSCHSLLNLHAHPSTPGQTICFNCTNIIHHPIGPPLLQCRICAATNPTPVLNYTCRVCSLYLAYSSTLPAVVCPVCHTVEPPIDTPVSRIPILLPLNHDAPPRPCPSLPPRHIPWLPSTPVRPVTTPRPAAHPRLPQQPPIRLPPSTLEGSVPSPSEPVPPGPTADPHHPIHNMSEHQTSPPPASSAETHQQQQSHESEPQPPHAHLPQSPHQPQSVPLNGDTISINGGDKNHHSPDDNSQQAPQPARTSSVSPSSKNVRQEGDVDTKD